MSSWIGLLIVFSVVYFVRGANETDLCTQSPCLNNGICTSILANSTSLNSTYSNASANYSCSCSSGFHGRNCSYVDACLTALTCPAASTCVRVQNTHRCDCATGKTGANCQLDVSDPCKDNGSGVPCQNEGICSKDNSAEYKYKCKCKITNTGMNCEDKHICYTSPCLNGGRCQVKANNQYRCLCDEPNTGPHCEVNFIDHIVQVTFQPTNLASMSKIQFQDHVANVFNSYCIDRKFCSVNSGTKRFTESEVYVLHFYPKTLSDNTVLFMFTLLLPPPNDRLLKRQEIEAGLNDADSRTYFSSKTGMVLAKVIPYIHETPTAKPPDPKGSETSSSTSMIVGVVVALLVVVVIVVVIFFIMMSRKKKGRKRRRGGGQAPRTSTVMFDANGDVSASRYSNAPLRPPLDPLGNVGNPNYAAATGAMQRPGIQNASNPNYATGIARDPLPATPDDMEDLYETAAPAYEDLDLIRAQFHIEEDLYMEAVDQSTLPQEDQPLPPVPMDAPLPPLPPPDDLPPLPSNMEEAPLPPPPRPAETPPMLKNDTFDKAPLENPYTGLQVEVDPFAADYLM